MKITKANQDWLGHTMLTIHFTPDDVASLKADYGTQFKPFAKTYQLVRMVVETLVGMRESKESE